MLFFLVAFGFAASSAAAAAAFAFSTLNRAISSSRSFASCVRLTRVLELTDVVPPGVIEALDNAEEEATIVLFLWRVCDMREGQRSWSSSAVWVRP